VATLVLNAFFLKLTYDKSEKLCNMRGTGESAGEFLK